MRRAVVLVCVCALWLGCGGQTPRQLVDIYRPEADRVRAGASSVIFVPGVMGSVLRDPDDESVVWGHVWDRNAKWDELLRDLALPYDSDVSISALDDDIVPGGELLLVELDLRIAAARARGYPGIFEGIVQALADAGAHARRPRAISKDDIEAGRDPIIGFGYDWRRDITSEANRLHQVVLAASRARESATGEPRIDIIAHSMGTQLVRYYLRYGPEPLAEEGPLPEITWEGARLVRRVLLLGPPNRGEAQALEILTEGVTVNPVMPHYPAALNATFPSGYEMLPRAGDERIVYDDGEEVDVFDVEVWKRYGWGPFAEDQDEVLRMLLPDEEIREARLLRVGRHVERNLRFAKRFHALLDRPARPPSSLGLHVAAGDTTDTNAVLEVAREEGTLRWRETAPGDGTVTRTSALGQPHRTPHGPATIFPDSVHFVAEEHLGMTGDADLINHILYWLLQAPSPGALERGQIDAPPPESTGPLPASAASPSDARPPEASPSNEGPASEPTAAQSSAEATPSAAPEAPRAPESPR